MRTNRSTWGRMRRQRSHKPHAPTEADYKNVETLFLLKKRMNLIRAAEKRLAEKEKS